MTLRKQRIVLAGALGLTAGVYLTWHRWRLAEQPSDLMQVWVAARAWLQGQNPYSAVRNWGLWPFPLLYPFPAVVALAPLALLPVWLADAIFVFLGTALLAWGVTRHGLVSPQLLVFASPPFLYAMVFVQWSPLLTGAALVPWAGFLLACKPTIGLALFAAFPRRATLAGGAALVLCTVLIWPGWIHEWRAALAGAPNAIAPVTLPGGALTLLALIKWRRPEARLLAVLASVPHTTLLYEAVPLFLIPQTWPEAWVLWGGTFLALIGHQRTGPYASQLAWVHAAGLWLLVCGYLPCLVMILRRPNVAPATASSSATTEMVPFESEHIRVREGST
jgi:hypothetical protein